jgi:hypothetical protein
MPDLEDCYLAMLIIDRINDPVIPLSYPVTISVAGELFRTLGPGTCSQGLNFFNDALAISFGTNCLQFLRSRSLDQ